MSPSASYFVMAGLVNKYTPQLSSAYNHVIYTCKEMLMDQERKQIWSFTVGGVQIGIICLGGHLALVIKMWNDHVIWSNNSSSGNLSSRKTQVSPKFIARALMSALFLNREKNKSNLNVHQWMSVFKYIYILLYNHLVKSLLSLKYMR